MWWDPKNIFYRKPHPLVSLSGGNCAFWKRILMVGRNKKELRYCYKRVGGEDTIMCAELKKLGRLNYDPDISVVHNKRCSFLGMLRESISLGCCGAVVSATCGTLLLKEPHRFYKAVIYLFSLFLFLSMPLMIFVGFRQMYAYLLVVYLMAQLPFIILVSRLFSVPAYALFSPFVIFVTDICHFFGQAKMISSIFKEFINSVFWHVRFIINIIRPSGLSKIFLFITKRCNADCCFCFNKQDRNTNLEKELSLKEINNITSKIGFLPALTITGGEPFLRKDIADICRSFCFKCGTRIMSIVTNGTHPFEIEEAIEKILAECRQVVLTIIVALDDIAERHDKIKGVPHCYANALLTLEKLNSLQKRFPNLRLGINTIISEKNSDRIEEIVDYFSHNLNYDYQYLNLLRQPPCTSVESKLLISIDKYFDLVKRTTLHPSAGGRVSFIEKIFYQALLEHCCDKAARAFKRKRSDDVCLAGRKFFVIDNDGSLFPCELIHENLGNLVKMKYDFKKIKNNQITNKFRLKLKASRCYCQWPCATALNGYARLSSYPGIFKYMFKASR
jgi:MoaA/NifB/PqqE/SkfB family radical SAM enzyme